MLDGVIFRRNLCMIVEKPGRHHLGTLDTSHSCSGQIVPAITAAISAISGHLWT